jgi:glycine/D-amino acid oxidase-like deaminating enzyme
MTVIDQDRGIYFRPDVGNLTLVGIRSSHPGEVVEVDADSYDGNIEMEFKANTALQLAHRLPAMANALWRRDWTGVDGYTPDGHMVLGPAEGIEGLYVAAGMSGTGFKTGPAVGMAVADLVLDGQTTTVDVRPFRMSRFREGQPFPTDHDYVVPPYPDTA